jgi:hypothetical protein
MQAGLITPTQPSRPWRDGGTPADSMALSANPALRWAIATLRRAGGDAV